jgi:hypothetical protein
VSAEDTAAVDLVAFDDELHVNPDQVVGEVSRTVPEAAGCRWSCLPAPGL